jgi:hypothetical protein
MSISLNLVVYKHEDSKLIEENLKTVRCEEISQALLNLITDAFPMKTAEVYFDNEFEGSFEIKCFDNSDIASIISELKEHFHKLLSFEYNELIAKDSDFLDQEASSANSIVDILSDEHHHNPTELAIARFRILTGVIGVFMDKQTKLSDEVGAVIKLG